CISGGDHACCVRRRPYRSGALSAMASKTGVAVEVVTDPAIATGRRSRASIIRDYGIIISFIALFVVLAVTAPNFLSKENILNILYQNAPLAIAACGTTLVIIGGAFDLSLGALYALGGVVA